MSNVQTLILVDPEKIAEILAPYLDLAADLAAQRAEARRADDGRMVNYEEARRITGLGRTRFSQAVADGAIPHYPNGSRGKLFKLADLRNFEGYRPQSEAERRFEEELKNRKP